MVPVYHCPYEEGVLVLLCVVDRQLETAGISDFGTIDNVCGLKVLLLGGSYPSAASTHWDQVGFFFFGGGGGGGVGVGGYGGDETSSYLVHKSQACLSATFGQRE